ncbi:MAG: SLC13 family permease [Waddliaceae bacterium]
MNRKSLYLLFFFVLFATSIFCEVKQFPWDQPSNIKMAKEALTWEGWVTIAVFLLIFTGLVTEFRPPDIVMLMGTGFLVIVGILTPNQFLEGFSSQILMTIAMLCIVVRTLEVNGIIERVGKQILTSSKLFWKQILSLCVPVSFSSAFLNNTPIVLLMTPIVRKWALKNKDAPSKFLIPLSYAAVMGGACTLIGSSTNLIVYGALMREMPEAAFSFFELAWVGVPCCIAGLLFLMLFGQKLLPERIDPASAVSEETREFTGEFMVDEESPIANKKIRDVSGRYFPREILIQIERNNDIIDSPGPDFTLFVGDRLVFAGDIHQIAELHAIKGLKSIADPHFSLDISSSHFAEIVIPTTSFLVGKTLRQINFRKTYGASVLAVYRQGWRVMGNVRDIVLHSGDTLMLLSGEPWSEAKFNNKDFYYIRHHEKLMVFHPVRALFVLSVLGGMIVAAAMGIPILIASMIAVFALLVTRSINLREAQNSVIWNVLLLIGCSFALARAMETTGVASYFAQIVLSIVGTNPYMLIGGILLITILSTEFMTNNATALILFPIAFQTAGLAGYTSPMAIKAVGIAVAIGASCGYAIPTGYQTHMIVYGPGGYQFTDFIKTGIWMDLIFLTIATFLIPKLWPLI